MSATSPNQEAWGSKLGVILAVAGSAVGLGNFLRFPGKAAEYGGGAFMIPYFIAFLIVGIPICWAEWTLGRYAGRYGFHSAPGMFGVLWRNPLSKFIGAFALLIPVIIYMYYVYIESWCLAYAWFYATGQMNLGKNPAVYNQVFGSVIGDSSDGAVFNRILNPPKASAANIPGATLTPILYFFVITFTFNFIFIYCGLSKGIETFCKFAMPLLIVAALIVVGRVLTLPAQPIPEPWQLALPKVIPAERWQTVRQLALQADATPLQVKEEVLATFDEYFRTLTRVDAAARAQYDDSIPILPPAGFFNSEAGFSVAMARLRAPAEVEQAIQEWFKKRQAELSDSQKLQLKDLELDLIKLEKNRLKEIAKLQETITEIGLARATDIKSASANPPARPISEITLTAKQKETIQKQLRSFQEVENNILANVQARRQLLYGADHQQQPAQNLVAFIQQIKLPPATKLLSPEATALLQQEGAAELQAAVLRLQEERIPVADSEEQAKGIQQTEPTRAAYSEEQAKRIQERNWALQLAELPRTVWNGLGYMWNPRLDQLADPRVWVEAAGQIFFSLSIGFGIILCYASYLRKKDDVVLSGLTACSTNEFCEVILGGLVALPATFLFLGTVMTLDVISSGSSVGLGFNMLPVVFANMPGGQLFGAFWFGMLFLAGVTSSLSMLQPAIAFLEEGFGLKRRASVALLGLLTICGSMLVLFFSKGLAALDTMDFWIGSMSLYILATIEVILFGWVIGIDKGFAEAHEGASMRIPKFFGFVLKYITPTYLLIVFAMWLTNNAAEYVRALSQTNRMITFLFILINFIFLCIMASLASENWRQQGRGEQEVAE